METSNGAWIQAACTWLKLSQSNVTSDAITAAVAEANAADLEQLVEVLDAGFDDLSESPTRLRILMQALATRLLQLTADQADDVPAIDPQTLASLSQRLAEVDAQAAAHPLQMLAAQGDEESIDQLAALLAEAPPENWQTVALVMSPLWNAKAELLELFFDRLGDDTLHPATMAVLLDLANFSVRKGKLAQHPWRFRADDLGSLLNGVVQRLRVLESDPAKFGHDVGEVQRILSDSVALTVSLCDTLGLIGDSAAVPSLALALELSHRRIQAEAAGSLARLGDARGQQRLVELAADPVARLRAVHYAEELGFLQQIDEALRLPAAMAESELAAWLASPEQFGFPPTLMELIDTRSLYWPSYEEPQACYLFRYTYQVPTGQLSNVGIAGPATHAFNADLANLPVDDIYAAFAGWQAEHEDIFEVPLQLLNSAQHREADRLTATLEARQLQVSEVLALTFFLGEMALLALVEQDGKQLCAVTDGEELLCYPVAKTPTALTPDLVLSIFRGRKLLRTFNS